jgi:tRNA threonylcarbamoyladenosine biosynthesis protein TsaB
VAYLALDCSSPYLALALIEGRAAHTFCEEVGRDHARRLTGALDALFAEARRTPRDLAGVVVGVGPGSYTGLRVGVAAAQGISRSLGVPLRGESSLLAMAATALTDAAPRGVVALDARRGNVYAGVFTLTPEGPVLEGDLFKGARDALQERGLPYFENVPPDPGFLARRGALGANAALPIYL